MMSFLMLLLCGCSGSKPAAIKKEKPGKICGVWISYIELDKMVQSGNLNDAFKTYAEKFKDFGITDVFLHVVPFCDAAYNSKIYHSRYGTDILNTAVDICHKAGLKVHAWINPYRVKTSNGSIDSLSKDSIAYRWLFDDKAENDDNICFYNDGIYLNPAKSEVKQTVLEVVRELCRNYDIDGIHIDDYFYPTTDSAFDNKTYADYTKETENPLGLSSFRICNVNSLVSSIYTAIKFIDKDLVFSVSPAADIDKNKNTFFADIAAWCEGSCVDMIIPQLYFGFCYKNEDFCFENILSRWKDLAGSSNTKLVIGLAAYKVGTETAADGDEWIKSDDILSRETEICLKDKAVFGVAFYSCSSLFSDMELNTASREKIKTVLKGKI